MEDGIDFFSLLQKEAFKEPFVKGVMSSNVFRAGTNCGSIREKIRRDCANPETKNDRKVCDVLLMEELICYAKHICSDAYQEVNRCFKQNEKNIERCDDLIKAMADNVVTAKEREKSGDWLSERERQASVKCQLFNAEHEKGANEGMICASSTLSKKDYLSLYNCVTKAENPDMCLKQNPAIYDLFVSMGKIYASQVIQQTD